MKNLKFLSLLVILSAVLFTTQSCETDPCAEVVCQNNGTCNEEGKCDCPDGVSGEFCQTVDLCYNVTCDYDGVCDSGDCACIDVTENYLLGTWDFYDATGDANLNFNNTFNADGKASINGSIWDWTLNGRVITITDTQLNATRTYTIYEDGFSCNELRIFSSESSNDFVWKRRM